MSVLFCPLSTVFSVYLLQNEGDFDVCAYLAFSFSAVMPSYFSQSEKGVVLTCVCTWLSLCHVILLCQLPFLYFSQGGKRMIVAVVRTCFSPDS